MKPIKMKMRDMDSVLEYTTENPSIIHHQTYKMLDWIYKKKKITNINKFNCSRINR